MTDRPAEVTRLLREWRGGDLGAMERLMPVVYDELRRIARRHMRGERDDHTLQTTAVVHEAFLRLVTADVDVQDRAHFFALAATAMRRVLVDHARGRNRDKRGGGVERLPLSTALAGTTDSAEDVLDLDRALARLAALDERRSRLVELHFFGGLSYEEIAEINGMSRSAVNRDLRLARAFLAKELSR